MKMIPGRIYEREKKVRFAKRLGIIIRHRTGSAWDDIMQKSSLCDYSTGSWKGQMIKLHCTVYFSSFWSTIFTSLTESDAKSIFISFNKKKFFARRGWRVKPWSETLRSTRALSCWSCWENEFPSFSGETDRTFVLQILEILEIQDFLHFLDLLQIFRD